MTKTTKARSEKVRRLQ